MAEVFDKKVSNSLGEERFLKNVTVAEFLYQVAERKNLSWSKSTVSKWVVKFKTMLRRVGYLQGDRLIRPFIRPEAFGFLLLWAYSQTGSGRKAFDHPSISPWHMNTDERKRLLKEGTDKGWWHYAEGAGVLEFIPRVKSVEEWLNGLGTSAL